MNGTKSRGWKKRVKSLIKIVHVNGKIMVGVGVGVEGEVREGERRGG